MIPKFLLDTWTLTAPAIGNHLWQSTLFACAAALLTLAFRNNHARTRYGLWLAASLKFLVPFSLLSNVGTYLASLRPRTATPMVLSSAFQQFGQPFGDRIIPQGSRAAIAATSPGPIHFLPALLIVWLCGFLAVAFVWFVRWHRIRVSIRGVAPLRQGRELELLRQLERRHNMPKPIDIRLSPNSLEPGIFGIARPILVWPQGISDRLGDAHLDTILAHELLHVRRRDNLAAAFHMLVEAIFWFHPMVWWMGVRLIAERERACDEEVLESGSDRQVYAESILKICEFCVGSPLTCVSGVTGADLKKRIYRIMSAQVACELDIRRKLLLGTAAILAIAAPIVAGAFRAAPGPAASQTQNTTPRAPAFKVVSVKANKSGGEFSNMNVSLNPGDVSVPTGGLLSGTNVSLISYVIFAYKLSGSQLQLLLPTVPNWLIADRFDIRVQAAGNPSNDQLRRVMQEVLAERFKLIVHYDNHPRPAYALLLAKPGETGPQLRPHADDPPCSALVPASDGRTHFPETVSGGLPADCGRIEALPSSRLREGARQISMSLLASYLPQAGNLDRPVLDQTGLSGTYDFSFEHTPQHADRANPHGMPADSAFQQDLANQLGLRLEPQTAATQVFIIDHVERLAEN